MKAGAETGNTKVAGFSGTAPLSRRRHKTCGLSTLKALEAVVFAELLPGFPIARLLADVAEQIAAEKEPDV